MSQRPRWLKWFLPVVSGGAWLFAIGTLTNLCYVAWARWPGTNSTSHIMSISVNGQDHVGLGFHYVGIAGTLLVLAEAILVTAAIVMSVLPKPRLRLIGHAALILWAGLWLGNAIYVSNYGFSFIWGAIIAAVGFCLVCTVARALRGCMGTRVAGAPDV